MDTKQDGNDYKEYAVVFGKDHADDSAVAQFIKTKTHQRLTTNSFTLKTKFSGRELMAELQSRVGKNDPEIFLFETAGSFFQGSPSQIRPKPVT